MRAVFSATLIERIRSRARFCRPESRSCVMTGSENAAWSRSDIIRLLVALAARGSLHRGPDHRTRIRRGFGEERPRFRKLHARERLDGAHAHLLGLEFPEERPP